MNKITEALKLVEKTLRDIIRVYKFETGTPVTALAAIRQVLDHFGDANEMVMDWSKVKPEAIKSDPMYQMGYAAAKAEPVKQKPVAWHDKIKGMEVSVDVSTGEDDAHHRVFGRVDSVMLESCGAQEDIILVIEESRNYAAPVSAKLEWVDLTDDELKAALEVHQVGLSVRIGRIAIAAFKDKNK